MGVETVRSGRFALSGCEPDDRAGWVGERAVMAGMGRPRAASILLTAAVFAAVVGGAQVGESQVSSAQPAIVPRSSHFAKKG